MDNLHEAMKCAWYAEIEFRNYKYTKSDNDLRNANFWDSLAREMLMSGGGEGKTFETTDDLSVAMLYAATSKICKECVDGYYGEMSPDFTEALQAAMKNADKTAISYLDRVE